MSAFLIQNSEQKWCDMQLPRAEAKAHSLVMQRLCIMPGSAAQDVRGKVMLTVYQASLCCQHSIIYVYLATYLKNKKKPYIREVYAGNTRNYMCEVQTYLACTGQHTSYKAGGHLEQGDQEKLRPT